MTGDLLRPRLSPWGIVRHRAEKSSRSCACLASAMYALAFVGRAYAVAGTTVTLPDVAFLRCT